MTREDKILELINEYEICHKIDELDTPFQKSLIGKIHETVNSYDLLMSLRKKGNTDFTSSFFLTVVLGRTFLKVIYKYDPKITPKMALEKEVEVNATNKKGIKTGKRANMKFGRWLGQAFPFLSDNQKEKLVDWYFDNYGPMNAKFYRKTTGFESVVTKPMGKRVGFSTTIWQKSLANSCMRYSTEDLGLSKHPYSAYESGDWELCYLLDEDGKLLGRCLANLPTMTHSAIYGTSIAAVNMLKEKMGKLGYTQASDDGVEWDGSKLLYIEDTYENDDEDEILVHLMPYVDIFEGCAYHDRKYIYLSVSSNRPSKTYHVDPFEASGYNEL